MKPKNYAARAVNSACIDGPEPTWRQVVVTSLQMRVRLSSASDRRPSLAASRVGPDRKFLKKCCLTKNSKVDKWKELKNSHFFLLHLPFGQMDMGIQISQSVI